MSKAKIFSLILLGTLTSISIFLPDVVAIATFPFIVPGVILMLAPSVFFYFLTAIILVYALKFFKIECPTTLSLIFLICLGCLSSYLLNMDIYSRVRNFQELDMPLQQDFAIPSTIAIYSAEYRREGDICNQMCQLLLFNKAADNVIIITDPTIVGNKNAASVTSYKIEDSTSCADEYRIPKQSGVVGAKNIASRIAAGECLVKEQKKLSDAQAIFFHGKEQHIQNKPNFRALNTIKISLEYIEMLKNKGGHFEKIYRFSEISTNPYAYPLSFGLNPSFFGGSASQYYAFFSTELTVNGLTHYADPIITFKPQMEQLFGNALSEPNVP